MRWAPLLLVFVVACKSRGVAPSVPDAAESPAGSAAIDAAPAVPPPVERDAGEPGTSTTDAAAPRAGGELTLEVRGGYCPPDKQALPACRSYTYTLRTDGTLRGGKRRSIVPAAATDALFQQAADAFAAKHTCIPNAPDRGSQALTLRRSGSAEVARGGCGAAFEAVKTRLEALAAEP